MIEVSIIRLPICKTTPPIKLSSISDLSLIVPFTFSEISFSISEIVLSSICLEENKFALHAWNEVVVDGYWYPVDPTWNYIVPPLTHIKFDLLESVPATYNFKVVEIEYY